MGRRPNGDWPWAWVRTAGLTLGVAVHVFCRLTVVDIGGAISLVVRDLAWLWSLSVCDGVVGLPAGDIILVLPWDLGLAGLGFTWVGVGFRVEGIRRLPKMSW